MDEGGEGGCSIWGLLFLLVAPIALPIYAVLQVLEWIVSALLGEDE